MNAVTSLSALAPLLPKMSVGWLLLSLRIGATFMMTPIFHTASIPMTIRMLIVLALAGVLGWAWQPLAASAPAAANEFSNYDIWQAALAELALGCTMGLGILLAFAAISFAGRLGQSVKASEVIHAARTALSQWLQLRTVRSQAELVSEPAETLVPAGELELRVRPIGGGAASARRATVWTEIWSDGRFYRALPTTFEVHSDGVLAQSIVASNSTEFSTAGTQEAAEKEPGAVRSVPAAVAAVVAAPAQDKSTQEKLQVYRGQSAQLNSSAGSITVQATVQVLQDGANGQSVQVKSVSKNETFYARVIGPGQLEMAK